MGTDFDDDVPTFVENQGAIPRELPEDEDTTTPRRSLCPRCMAQVRLGGDAAHPTFEEMEQNAAGECWRSLDAGLGKSWWWCSARRPFVLMLTG